MKLFEYILCHNPDSTMTLAASIGPMSVCPAGQDLANVVMPMVSPRSANIGPMMAKISDLIIYWIH